MTQGKAGWQCSVLHCTRAVYQEEVCVGCWRKRRNVTAGLVQRDSTGVIKGIRPTGETRTSDGQRQAEMTDGRQRWWVGAMEVAA